MAGRLLHYSAAPLPMQLHDRSRELSAEMKPAGLWISVEGPGDWREWCEGEQWGLDRMTVAAEIILHADASILRIETARQLVAFHEEFVTKSKAAEIASLLGNREGAGIYASMFIDWPRVGARYDGIVIAPYQWSQRLGRGTRWYYGWDCASGCIWRPRAIATTRPVDGHSPSRSAQSQTAV